MMHVVKFIHSLSTGLFLCFAIVVECHLSNLINYAPMSADFFVYWTHGSPFAYKFKKWIGESCQHRQRISVAVRQSKTELYCLYSRLSLL